MLIVAADSRAAENFATELQSFMGGRGDENFLERRIHVFPERVAPPLEMISPPTEVEAGRSAALYQLAKSKAPILVASAVAVM